MLCCLLYTSLNKEFLAGYLNDMLADEKLSVEEAKNPKTIVIDYGGPNVAKPLHVGHLRSAIIGESIKRMGRFLGHKVIGDVHLGDWGLQMGLIITCLLYTSWITEFPLLEWSEEDERFTAMHHPFTMPMEEDLQYIDTDPGRVRGKAYDIVLNGNEIDEMCIRDSGRRYGYDF